MLKSLLSAFTDAQNTGKTMREISNEFYQGELTIIIMGVIFEEITVHQIFFQVSIHFHPCHQ